jgi:hypothetical protein
MLTTAKRLAFPANCDRNVTVQSGDTCDAISAANSVSTYVPIIMPFVHLLIEHMSQIPAGDSQQRHH